MMIYKFYDLYRRTFYRDMPLVNVEFNDPVDALVEGKMTALLPVGDDVDQLLLDQWTRCMVNHRTWVLVVHPITQQVLWNGIMLKRPWSIAKQAFSLEFEHSRWWLGKRFTGTGKNPTNYDVLWDKLEIARRIVGETKDGRWGDPHIAFDGTLSGQHPTYRLEARAFKPISVALAELGAGSKGFEWDLITGWNGADELPELRLVTYYPELKYSARISLRYNRDGSGNILSVPDEWPNDATEAVSRVWALGSGTDQQQTVVYDTDPAVNYPSLASDGKNFQLLLTEKVTSYSNTNDRKTLAENARAERLALSLNSGTLEVGVSLTDPDITTYWKGIRARLQVKDRFLNIDKPNVRVIEVKVKDQDRDSLAKVTLVLDLNDYKLPDGLDA